MASIPAGSGLVWVVGREPCDVAGGAKWNPEDPKAAVLPIDLLPFDARGSYCLTHCAGAAGLGIDVAAMDGPLHGPRAGSRGGAEAVEDIRLSHRHPHQAEPQGSLHPRRNALRRPWQRGRHLDFGVNCHAEVRSGGGRPLLNALRRGDEVRPPIHHRRLRRLSRAQGSIESGLGISEVQDLLTSAQKGKAAQRIIVLILV